MELKQRMEICISEKQMNNLCLVSSSYDKENYAQLCLQ